MRTTDILRAREKVMDCMNLFYKMEGKDMEKVLTGCSELCPFRPLCAACGGGGGQGGHG